MNSTLASAARKVEFAVISIAKKRSLHSELRRKSLRIERSINLGVVIEINENVERHRAPVFLCANARCGQPTTSAIRRCNR